MYNEFLIDQPGLHLDGKVLMPGTRLLHKGEPPSSWKNVGHATGAVVERKLVVASPAEQPAAQEPEQPAHNEQPAAQPVKRKKDNK